MNTPPNDHAEAKLRPLKKMRKGTKSCSECRRRKIRCIFKEGSPLCEGCTTRGSQCVGQAYVENIKLANKRIKGHDASLSTGAVIPTSAKKSYTISPGQDFGNAPLLSVFDNAIIRQKHDDGQESAPLSAEVIHKPLDDRENQIISTLKSLAPVDGDLILILQISRGNWELWRVLFSAIYGINLERQEDAQFERLRVDISQALQSDNIVKISKVLLCLAICYQVCAL